MKAFIVWTALALCVASTAYAEDKRVFDPSSGSYFELHRITKQESPTDYFQALNYTEAMRAASQRVFKGARGRLAVIKNPQTHQLIVTELAPTDHAWIGLKYVCTDRSLRWVNGETMTKRSFNAWHAQWNQDPQASCTRNRNVPFMGVAYTSVKDSGGRWVAKGPNKRYSYYIVEFPTGSP